MSKAKQNALLVLAVAVVVVIALAMSLQHVSLSPGEPFALAEQEAVQGGGSVLAESNWLAWVLRGIVALMVILIPVYIGYSLMSKEGRRRLLVNLIILGLLLFVADRMQQLTLKQESEQQAQVIAEPEQGTGGSDLPVSVFPEEPPAWLTVGVIVVAAAVLVAVGVLVYTMQRRRRMVKPDTHLEALAEAAQQTIATIREGGDLKTSVIACYREMSRVVQQQRGIEREIAMTPREFEDVLISRGLPGDSVRTLTRLFESVRYGSTPDGAQEEMQAVACLTEIVEACKTMSGRAYAES